MTLYFFHPWRILAGACLVGFVGSVFVYGMLYHTPTNSPLQVYVLGWGFAAVILFVSLCIAITALRYIAQCVIQFFRGPL